MIRGIPDSIRDDGSQGVILRNGDGVIIMMFAAPAHLDDWRSSKLLAAVNGEAVRLRPVSAPHDEVEVTTHGMDLTGITRIPVVVYAKSGQKVADRIAEVEEDGQG